jgi:hypothetical protein
MTDITAATSAPGFDSRPPDRRLHNAVRSGPGDRHHGHPGGLILPLPTWLLDFSLAFSLSFSILILMTAVFIRKPLEFQSFPTILLITTMLRLALNLASTRLILAMAMKAPPRPAMSFRPSAIW